MSWWTEWKAISAQIQGLLEAARFYIGSAPPNDYQRKDEYAVANKHLIPHIKKITEILSKFKKNYNDSIPPDAANSLTDLLDKDPTWPTSNDFGYVHIMVTVL